MKKVLFLMFWLFFFVWGTASVNAQVRVGENTAPRAGAILDLKSSSYIGGLLLPNVNITDPGSIPDTFTDAASIADRDNCSELTGLLVWNTHSGSEGVYMWDGADWKLQKVGSGAGGSCLGVPAAPTSVSFSADLIGQNSTVVASCDLIADANLYYWELPAGLEATSLVTSTNSIIISTPMPGTFGAGKIVVRVSNECGMNCATASSSSALVVTRGGLVPLSNTALYAAANKGNATCPEGVPLSYGEAHPVQRENRRLAGGDFWYAGWGTDRYTYHHDGVEWVKTERPTWGAGSFTCF